MTTLKEIRVQRLTEKLFNRCDYYIETLKSVQLDYISEKINHKQAYKLYSKKIGNLSIYIRLIESIGNINNIEIADRFLDVNFEFKGIIMFFEC